MKNLFTTKSKELSASLIEGMLQNVCNRVSRLMSFERIRTWHIVSAVVKAVVFLIRIGPSFEPWSCSAISAGTIFRLGKQKLVKNNQHDQIQSITLRNYVSCTQCTMRSGAKGEFSRNFVSKVTLQSVRLLLTVSYRKMGEQDILVAPPIICWGSNCLPYSPGPRACVLWSLLRVVVVSGAL